MLPYECPICYESFTQFEMIESKCKHMFCRDCSFEKVSKCVISKDIKDLIFIVKGINNT